MLRMVVAAVTALFIALPDSVSARNVTDAMGRTIDVPETVSRVICSGPGALRLLTYLQAQDMAVAVDDIETRRNRFDARPYALANPQFKALPTFGEFRGHDNPELILSLSPEPQVILKTYGAMGHDPVELQQKTGIPVVVLEYGDLGRARPKFFQALRIMGEVIGRKDRAEAVVAFFEERIADLKVRTAKSKAAKLPSAYIGGVASKGPHGYQSTEPAYPPFGFVGIRNVANTGGLSGKELAHTDVAKEKIVEWNPDLLFLDLSSEQLGEGASALHELKTDPAYRTLTAVEQGKVYGLLPYNWYSRNFGSILANAYYIGALVHPEAFNDVDPAATADGIYSFLVGKPVFKDMNALFGGMAYTKVPVD